MQPPPPGAPRPPPSSVITQRGRSVKPPPDADERMWSMVVHVVGMFLPLVGPWIMWSLKKDESEFVAYHCAQAVWYSALTFGFTVVLTIVTCGAGSVVGPVFWLGAAYWALKAREGSWQGFPLIDRFGHDGTLL